MKKATLLLVAMTAILALCACSGGNPSSAADPAISETTAVSETTAATASTEPAGPPLYPLMDWDGESENWVTSDFSSLDAVHLDLYFKGFREVDFCSIIHANMGEDILDWVYQYDPNDNSRFQMTFTYKASDGETSKWILRGANTGEPRDFSGVTNPDMSSVIDFGTREFDGLKVGAYDAVEVSETSMHIDYVKLYYAPKTGNMYSMVSPSGGLPEPMFFWGNPYAEDLEAEMGIEFVSFCPVFDARIPETIIGEFTLVTGEERKTYSYRAGTTFKEWIDSEYNTDGWHTRNGDGCIYSADNQYYLYGEDSVRPLVGARPA